MKYDFLVVSYASERLKVLSVWSEFRDEDLPVRPRADDPRGRSVHEHMVHQCVSEDAWFRTMLDIAVSASPLPPRECRLEFMRRYAEDSASRLAMLRETDEDWWEAQTTFFDVKRSRAWVMTRRLNHTSHHRGQQMAMLRMLGRELHSNYGPTADTGGLMQNHAPTIYAYASVDAILSGEASGGAKSRLPGAAGQVVTERPQQTVTRLHEGDVVHPEAVRPGSFEEVVRGTCLEAALAAYEDAGIRGLCAEGRWEAALAAMRQADLDGVNVRRR